MKTYILMLFLTVGAYAQTLHVRYQLQIDLSGTSPKPFRHDYLLDNSNGKSVQKKFLVGTTSAMESHVGNVSTKIVKIGKDTTYVFKDFINNRLYSEENIFNKTFAVSDALNIFSWEIQSDTLSILKYKCRKAVARFRGREYIAYFAEEIPIPDGPAKFNGLPGLILKVTMIDPLSIYNIDAVELGFEKSDSEIANPFTSGKVMSLADFKKEYRRKYAELQSFASEQSQSGESTLTLPKVGIEQWSDE